MHDDVLHGDQVKSVSQSVLPFGCRPAGVTPHRTTWLNLLTRRPGPGSDRSPTSPAPPPPSDILVVDQTLGRWPSRHRPSARRARSCSSATRGTTSSSRPIRRWSLRRCAISRRGSSRRASRSDRARTLRCHRLHVHRDALLVPWPWAFSAFVPRGPPGSDGRASECAHRA